MGFESFDFGRSTPNEGTFRFKKQWGAKPAPLHWADFKPGDNKTNDLVPVKPYKPSNPANPTNARQFAEKIISNTPVSISKFFGMLIRKYITL